MKLPPLFKKDTKGKTQIWEIEVIERNDGSPPFIQTSSGKLNGRRIVKGKYVRSGKNIGKSNETTPLEQAQAEAKSTWQRKKDKGYSESVDDSETFKSSLPMLAHKYTERKHDIIFPCYVQPKLDGVRCLITKENNTIKFISRGGKTYPGLEKHNKLIISLLHIMPNNTTLDGEIYYHGWSLQRIVSAAKKYKKDTDLLEFWVFDMVSDEIFEERNIKIYRLSYDHNVKLVKSIMVQLPEEINKFHNMYVKDGFEGIIIRNKKSYYESGQRSKNLQKYKEFTDKEFEIVDTYSEINHINGIQIESICFRCKTYEGKIFDVRPKGTLENRAEMWKNKDSYIGKYLTVRYQALTDDKIPQFPIGIIVRDYE